jgi:hypothetical protein
MALPEQYTQKGHPNYGGGRPRTSIPEKEELIELGKDLLEWAAEKKKGELRCRWCEWFAAKHFFIRKQWKRMIDTDEFRPYYEAAQVYLGNKYIDGTINPSIAQRYLRLYDPDLREDEDATADADAARKASALKSEAKALEEERLKVLEEVQRNKRVPQ